MKMTNRLQQMAADRSVQISLGLSLLFLAATALLPWWQLFPDVQSKIAVPLHYNIHFGIDLFGPWWRLFMPAIFGAIIAAVNVVGALWSWRGDHVLSRFFLFVCAACQIVLFVGVVFVVLLNLAYD